MKYKDYLILPVFLMYLLYASCAYVAKINSTVDDDAPEAQISPTEIVWGCGKDGYGEYWYANGQRGTECFSVIDNGAMANEICFFENGKGSDASQGGVRYTVTDLHMCCTDDGRKYDIIFPDEMTAYDTVSGTVYKRADYSKLYSSLTSGKFVNDTNPNDWYVLKESGKSLEYFGDMVFPGKWKMATSDTLDVHDKRTDKDYTFHLIFDAGGAVKGFTFDDVTYSKVS